MNSKHVEQHSSNALRFSLVDTFSKTKRSQIMRSVRSSGTGAEQRCQALLEAMSVRFERHVATLPGKPDFVFPVSRMALFVHGCFWHSHKGCKHASLPESNVEYWTQKIQRNRRRDSRVRSALRKAGWHTAVIWECATKDKNLLARRLTRLTGKKFL